jgi:ribosomal-protein-alanine N-acetyltransferase
MPSCGASVVDVTRYVGWPRHQSVADTLGFVAFSEAAWVRHSVGPYLLGLRTTGRLVGGSGISVEAGGLATTGYVLARDAWSQGFATEALGAMVTLAGTIGLTELQAFCHPQHRPSQHVLEKCSFLRDATWRGEAEFPNPTPGVRVPTARYVRRA